MAIAIAVIGIPYAFAGYAKFDVQNARSGMLPVSYLANGTTGLSSCIKLFSSQNKNGGSSPVVDPVPYSGYYVSLFYVFLFSVCPKTRAFCAQLLCSHVRLDSWIEK